MIHSKEFLSLESAVIYHESQHYAGWPANAGMWHWGNEVLVAFHVGRFLRKRVGHQIDYQKNIRTVLARSLDGGKHWRIETDSNIHARSMAAPVPLPPEGLDFSHPNFALKVGHASVDISNSTYLVTYDRGRTWQGPYLLPEGDDQMTARTDYLIEGKSSCILFLSRKTRGIPCRSHPDRAYAVRTDDGGKTWTFLGYMADKRARSALTNTVRMTDGSLISAMVRRYDVREGQRIKSPEHGNHWIEIRRSSDGGAHWRTLSTVDLPYNLRSKTSSPTCLGHLPDGRLVMHYAFRGSSPRLIARISSDGGKQWGEEIVLDHTPVSDDIGYPLLAMLPFGTVLVVYHSATEQYPQQHTRCILWKP